MSGQHLTPDSEFRVDRAHQNLHSRLARQRGWHFDITAALADIGQSAVIGDAGAEAVDFRSYFAVEAVLSAAVTGVGDEGGFSGVGTRIGLGARLSRRGPGNL